MMNNELVLSLFGVIINVCLSLLMFLLLDSIETKVDRYFLIVQIIHFTLFLLVGINVNKYYRSIYLMNITSEFISIEWFILVISLLLISIIYCLFKILDYHKSYLSQFSIKNAIDYLDAGVCFYNQQGRILLINNEMMDITRKIFQNDILDGRVLYDYIVKNAFQKNEETVRIIQINEKYYKFVYQVLRIDKSIVQELISTDITKEIILSQKLREENEKLQIVNNRLKNFNSYVDKVTRQEEILNAKIRIHDDLGHLLLMAKRSLNDPENASERVNTTEKWRNIIHLLSSINEKESNYDFKELVETAKLIGVQIHFNRDMIIQSRKTYDVVFTAIHESLTNTVSHAGGKNLYVDFSKGAKFWKITIKNDGNSPSGPIILGGGLSNLKKKVMKTGGKLNFIYEPEFALVVRIPIEGVDYERKV